jgi:hypothetical protein
LSCSALCGTWQMKTFLRVLQAHYIILSPRQSMLERHGGGVTGRNCEIPRAILPYALWVSFIIDKLHVIIINLDIITGFVDQHENRPSGMKRCSIRHERHNEPYERLERTPRYAKRLRPGGQRTTSCP